MLVLTRKKDQSIVINNDIRIVVVEIRGDKVRLGIEAPKEVPVHRHEVFDAIADTSADSATVDAEAGRTSVTLASAALSVATTPTAAATPHAGREPASEGVAAPIRPR